MSVPLICPLPIRMLLVVLGAVLMMAACDSPATQAEPPSFLRRFQSNAPASDIRYELKQEDGPWMILATTFVGENAKQSAETTAAEIRQNLRVPAFIYREKFDFTKSEQDATSARRVRYANAYEYEAYAVLVGEYDSIEHPGIEKDLANLKTLQLSVYADPSKVKAELNTQTPATTLKAFSHKLFKTRKGRDKGPMTNAFVTRNPMLPEEYFTPPKVDSFVHQLNEDKPYSLLECSGKYTVVVCTFEGLGTIVDGRKEKNFEPSMKRLDKFAADAGKVVAKLRKDGDEAYQYHDRHRSLVTVGSFETLGRPLPNGGFEYAPEILRTMKKYSAFNAQVARRVPGKSGIAANHAAMIPFDVQPTPIAVPKSSKRGLFQAKFGMR